MFISPIYWLIFKKIEETFGICYPVFLKINTNNRKVFHGHPQVCCKIFIFPKIPWYLNVELLSVFRSFFTIVHFPLCTFMSLKLKKVEKHLHTAFFKNRRPLLFTVFLSSTLHIYGSNFVLTWTQIIKFLHCIGIFIWGVVILKL